MNLSKALQGFILSRTADGYAPGTIDLYQWTINQLALRLNDPQVADITITNLRNFMASLYSQNLAPATIDNHWKSIRAFFGWANTELSIPRPDLQLARPRYKPPEIQPFTEDEIKALLKACEKTKIADSDRRKSWQQSRPTKLRDQAVVLTLLDTGLRAGELCRLQIKDLTLVTGEIHVAPFGSGRKTTPRTVYIGKAAQKTLWRYLAQVDDKAPESPLFLSQMGKGLTKSALSDMLWRLGDRAGVKNVFPHRFRHTFATQYLRNGGDVFTLQRILGHSSLAMVQRYLAIAQADVGVAHNRASPVDRWRL